jgi:1-acyl-sn-glycerol-3-phosphate acyltransferase
MTGFAKIETWDNPILRRLFNLWEAIPITRGAFDKKAFRLGLEALKQGRIVGIAPEGTRSGHGCLQRGNAGVVLLALLSRAPLLPVVYWGGERFWENIHRLRRTDVHIAVGHPFTLDTRGRKMTREIRQEITDEIMFQLAALLPPVYRGEYRNLAQATERYLVFQPPSTSNLRLLMA